MANIIIKGKTSIGKTRSEQEVNLRKEWGPTMDDGMLSQLKHLEKKVEEKLGIKQSHIKLIDVNKVR